VPLYSLWQVFLPDARAHSSSPLRNSFFFKIINEPVSQTIFPFSRHHTRYGPASHFCAADRTPDNLIEFHIRRFILARQIKFILDPVHTRDQIAIIQVDMFFCMCTESVGPV